MSAECIEVELAKIEGLKFADCVKFFANRDGDERKANTREERERHQSIVQMAKDEYHRDGEVEVDDTTVLSEGEDNGAYVCAWVWVGFTGTTYDKENLSKPKIHSRRHKRTRKNRAARQRRKQQAKPPTPNPSAADLPTLTLRCEFHPQAWVRDCAVEVDAEGPTEFTAPWPAGKPLPKDDREETDNLREAEGVPNWIRDWHGPFYVEILNRDELEEAGVCPK